VGSPSWFPPQQGRTGNAKPPATGSLAGETSSGYFFGPGPLCGVGAPPRSRVPPQQAKTKPSPNPPPSPPPLPVPGQLPSPVPAQMNASPRSLPIRECRKLKLVERALLFPRKPGNLPFPAKAQFRPGTWSPRVTEQGGLSARGVSRFFPVSPSMGGVFSHTSVFYFSPAKMAVPP